MAQDKSGKKGVSSKSDLTDNSDKNQSDRDFSGQTIDRKSTLSEFEQVLDEFGFVKQEKERAEKLNIMLLPSIRDEFKSHAESLNMTLSEFLRRAAFAAHLDPTALRRADVEEAEDDYRARSRSSRWTRGPR